MMPTRSHIRIRSISIHYYSNYSIMGFAFFDKEGALLWDIGDTTWLGLKVETVLVAETEVIIGVVAKLVPGSQSLYSDFQFQVAVRL
jgi:hypothetical protein